MNIDEVKKEMLRNPSSFKNELGERKIEDLTELDFDFQGWLIPNLTLRQILEQIGFVVDEETNRLYINNNDSILDRCPNVIEDDGMGYGSKTSKITHIEKLENINIWI